MNNSQNITKDIVWVGASDRRIALFENIFPLENGVSYNSYVIFDKKTALLDTADAGVCQQYIENVMATLDGRNLDYLVLHHMEPDHCASIEAIAALYPDAKLVGNKKTFQLLEQFYTTGLKDRYYEVKEGDILDLGNHKLEFIFAPMVHWPEVMFSYEQTEDILFSADAFGTFGALSGNIFDDEQDFWGVYGDEFRRYYTNIVGKYGPSVQMAFKKVADKPVKMIAPLHGPVIRQNIDEAIEKYNSWSTYTPEKQGVVLVYGSMYGNTASAVDLLSVMLSQRGVEDLRVIDVSKTHASYIISDVFKYSNMVLACPTYNLNIYYPMDNFIRELAALNMQNRNYSIIGNGSWAPMAAKKMGELVPTMKNMTMIGEPMEITSALTEAQIPELEKLADEIAASLKK